MYRSTIPLLQLSLAILSPVLGLVISNNVQSPYKSIGCYTEGSGTRALGGAAYTNTTGMTEESCVSFCASKSFIYAGVEYGQECYCGNSFLGGSATTAASDCNMPCTGNATEFCGAGNRLNVFWNGASAPAPPVTNPGVNGWSYIGCYTDANPRTLQPGVGTTGGSSNMTIALCTAACRAGGYTYAGAEYAGECYCGNAIKSQTPVLSTGCNMMCNGNASEYCGGGNALNMYQFGVVSSSKASTTLATSTRLATSTSTTPKTLATSTTKPAASSTSSTVSSHSTTTAQPSSTSSISVPPTIIPPASSVQDGNPTVTMSTTIASSIVSFPTQAGIPPGWTYKGCWIDNVYGPVLQRLADNATMTLESCTNACMAAGYSIAGLEYSTQCNCGNQIAEAGALAQQDSDCSMTCGGNQNEICGAGNRLSVYSNSTITVLPVPVAQNTSLPGSWAYQGCYSDNGAGGRALPYQIILPQNNSAANCITQCSAFGYMYGGMEYGRECYCGDASDLSAAGSTQMPESDCGTVCTGNATYYCGGGNRLSLYKWTGTPFYQHSYPTGNNAGSYTYFIPGLITPLIATAGINGKITFVEKYGTSFYGNSTGAYELDPSLAPDFSKAWRTMTGITTDVFCSAGLILPDKGGRQINVGGWSGTSTYGIRFYTPDGAPGTNSTNMWQENANEVALQAGRWYPSAMIMTNGSILVVGGEIGSNSAPTPSLELLPRVGGTVYCDWLARTDPNNLYPFLAVLPSGGIFVAYYNEARILDAGSLGTAKELPMIPGAVNNAASGRTYPFEGTSVLLPQSAPYTDPLTVLICGGSNPGAAIALDNCVSIQPDAAEPQWTMERMPSKRVMSCMVALPDGTFLILNGAHQGVAGFGLATDPNLNAVLYDPSKPVGSRMSIMANTTIARLYHSEAVLMDDGRVVVSGSDPQDGVHPEEMRIEVFTPPYILNGQARPSFTIANKDWSYGQAVPLTVTIPSGNTANVKISLLGAVSSTHGNSMGQRTIFPAFSCSGGTCTVTAPPNANICPPGWFQVFVLDGGVPSTAQWVRIGGDPGGLGSWPNFPDFTQPGS